MDDLEDQILHLCTQNLPKNEASPEKNGLYVAQSTLALSTAKTVPEKEVERMEASDRHTRLMNNIVAVWAGSILISPIREKPGFAMVFRPGSTGEPVEMALSDNEEEQSILLRKVSGLEETDVGTEEEPPLLNSICRLCKSNSSHRCKNCWSSYCSRSCQKMGLAIAPLH